MIDGCELFIIAFDGIYLEKIWNVPVVRINQNSTFIF